MSDGTEAPSWRSIVRAASEPYARVGRFAWHFARGKLTWDPVFAHLIARGLIAPHSRVLDIGCGQGLLASLVAAADREAGQGRWPSGWAEAPAGARVTGIELAPRDVFWARQALGGKARFICGDMRTLAFPATDTVVILDVLHYVDRPEQDDVLARARATLASGGRMILRVGDAASRRGFAASQWIDRLVSLLRGRRSSPRSGRTLAEWQHRLAGLGFEVSCQPMHRGTPFPNVLLVGTVA